MNSLELAYLALSFTMVLILTMLARHVINKTVSDSGVRNKNLLSVFSGLILWHIYMSLIGLSGFLQDFSLPPRFPIFLIAPAFIFTFFFLKNNKDKQWIKEIPTHWLAFYQAFRIVVESLFVWSVAEGVLHANVTIEGYNYDMFMGLSAPIIGLLVWWRKEQFSTLFKVWNYAGLLVLLSVIFVFFTSIYLPTIYPETIHFPTYFGAFPYVFVAGFLMPSAVFIHFLSLVHLKKG